jgi:hypothetical protein
MNAPRPPAASRSPMIVKALATRSERAANGFRNLVTVFLLLMVQAQACREGVAPGQRQFLMLPAAPSTLPIERGPVVSTSVATDGTAGTLARRRCTRHFDYRPLDVRRA